MGRVTRVTSILILLAVLFPLTTGWGSEKKSFFLGKPGKGENRGPEQPLRITSQTLEADNKKQVIIFTGNVVAKQGEWTLHADTARVYYEKKDGSNDVREIVASGNVKIYRGDGFATGQKAVLNNTEQKIVLTGQPKVWQGKDMISGEKVTVFLEEEKSFVEGSPERKVEVILHPKSEQPSGKGKP